METTVNDAYIQAMPTGAAGLTGRPAFNDDPDPQRVDGQAGGRGPTRGQD